ncbi:MAG: 7-cyano-7-deazaguanine synthase QueC [Planctomycetota bacterium]|nr:7-cyano-7-deazaguanine synthase QueC [Planctomycetota bacterium]
MGKIRAVVLLSGGVDSATTLAMALSEGKECHALTVDYGQRHRREIDAAERIATSLGAAQHAYLRMDLRPFATSALTGGGEVPRHRAPEEIGQGIPPTYVPARNTILLALALAWAESLEALEIFIGANVQDYSGYPDCRPEFMSAFEEVIRLGTRQGAEGRGEIRILTPLIRWSKAQIVKKGVELGVDFGLTWSCYDPTERGEPCRGCDACLIRAKGFAEAGLPDPLIS